ncbi:MAG: YhjD/YihY/BrkB family envelope integrity protein [Planctomycetota bacterium]|jgi:membrane protein
MMKLRELLPTPSTQLGKASRFVVFQIKLWSHCARLLKKNRSGQQAAALSYHTIFGIVPLAIVMLLIFQSFSASDGIGQEVKKLVYEQLNLTEIKFSLSETDETSAGPQAEEKLLTEYLDEIVDTFFTDLDKGSLTIVSGIIVIWAALALLSTVERAFNSIWHVAMGRNFLQRVINYWAVLTLGPLLIGVGVYISTTYATFGQIQETLLSFSRIGPALLSYLVATIAFFLLYFVLPNTKVHAKAAIWGALVAALVWTSAKWGFREYVTEFIPYSKVYGIVGLVPLGVIWIFITWLIILFGLQLTFTTQHLKSLDAAEIAGAKKTEEYFIANDLTIINIVREIAVAFQENQAPVSPEVICSRLDIPAEFGQKILDHLVNCGLIVRTSDPREGFLPAKDPANIKLSEIAEAVAAAGFAQSTSEWSVSLRQVSQSQRSLLAQHTLKQTLNLTQNALAPGLDEQNLTAAQAES